MSQDSVARSQAAVESLQRQFDALGKSERLLRSTLDGLSAHVAIVDKEGVILFVNKAWRDFSETNGPVKGTVCEGANYIAVCEAVHDADRETALDVVRALRDVLTGNRDRCELEYACHSPETQRWFIVRITRMVGPGPNYAIVAHENITQRKQAEGLLAAQARDFEMMSASATHLLEPLSTDDLFTYAARQLRAVTGRALVVLSECNPETNELVVRAFTGPDDKLQRLTSIVGRDPVGLSFTVPRDVVRQMDPGVLMRLEDGLHELTFGSWPLPRCRQIEQALQLGEAYAIPFVLGDQFLGSVAILTDLGEPLKNRGVVEPLMNQVGLALRRKHAEDALRASETRHRHLFEQTGDYVLVFEKGSGGEMIISDLNEAALRAHGYLRHEMIGKPLALIDPDSSPEVFAARERVLEAGGSQFFSVRHRRKDGTCFDAEVNAQFVNLGDKRLLVCVERDITERKRYEEALRASEARFSRMFHASPLGITLTRLEDSRILDVNAAWQRLTGVFRSDALGRTSIELNLWVDPTERKRMLDLMFANGTVHAFEMRMRPHSGGLWNILLSAEPIELDGVDCMLTLAVDITERRQAEEALHRTEEQLRQSQKLEAIGQLAGGVAHDFRNQLTVIRGFAELLNQGGSVDAEGRVMIQEILRAVKRSSLLTGQLLSFSRKQSLTPRVADVNTAIGELASVLPQILGEDIEIVMNVSPNPCMASFDSNHLHQSLLNLAANARDAMRHGGTLTIATSIVSASDPVLAQHPDALKQGYVAIQVRDTGIGMDAATRGRLFEPFFTTKPVGEAVGLGLALVYGFVRQSGGFITNDSAPGEGSTFTLYLPEASGSRAAPVQQSLPLVQPQPQFARILVVEDEAGLRAMLVAFLRKCGHDVLDVAGPAAAIELISRQRPLLDLLITDLVMPGKSGLDLARDVQNHYPGIGVLFISGYADKDLAARGLAKIPGEFLHKPFGLDELGGRVQEILMRQRNKDNA